MSESTGARSGDGSGGDQDTTVIGRQDGNVQGGSAQGGAAQGEGRSRGKNPKVRKPNYALVGTIVISLLLIGLALGITRPEWQQYFAWGFTTREVNVAGDYFTLPNSSKVKISGVEVGRIDAVEQREDGTAVYTIRVQPDVIDKVGSAPSANVRPTTLLGGIVYVDLIPGGDRTQPWNDAIPLERTRLPVELSPVVQAIQPDAVAGLKPTVEGLQGALQQPGIDAVKNLAREAPGGLRPAAGAVNALTGQNPGTDLPAVVDGLQRTTSVLSRQDGQIEAILRDLRVTTRVFADTSVPVAEAIRNLPQALDTARPALARLSVTLDKLRDTAGPARPVVQELDRLLERLDPVLVNARPVVNDLRFAAAELRPVVEGLVPAAEDLTFVLDELNPSLDRINGPIVDTLESGFTNGGGVQGLGAAGVPEDISAPVTDDPLNHTGRRHSQVQSAAAQGTVLREELGPAIQSLAQTTGYVDGNGHGVAFNVGVGSGSIAGVPGLSIPQLFALFALANPGAGAAGLPMPGLPLPDLASTVPGAGAPAAGPGLPVPGVLTGGN